jgi:aspartyl-tRNA(Asn)/glutamyl-tRNA(Gln) amidotransferase subunit B
MQYEAVIGLEIHAQLMTDSKMFCGCSTKFGSEPNTQTCPVCIGMPGVLPVMNKKAIEYVIKTGLAVNCDIAPFSRFARKNYFYPDLPKGYQISQYELPICEHGFVEITVNGETRKIGLTRIHLEEDAGKNIHEDAGDYSFVDLNRAGTPLMEIVSEPDIRTPQEAAEFVKKLRELVRWIGVCDGNMEQGSLRCDANVSVRPTGQKEFGTRTEIKNMNSFKYVDKALDYEIKRQIKLLNDGGRIIQETRLWDSNRGITESMRSKEEAHDYRYFPDPDLVPIEVDNAWIAQIKSQLVELPDSRQRRFISQYSLPEQDADFLTSEKAISEWFEEAVKLGGEPKAVSNWMMGELMRRLNEDNLTMDKCPLEPKQLVDLLNFIDKGTINGRQAKIVFDEMYNRNKDIIKTNKGIVISMPVGKIAITALTPEIIIKEKGLVQVSDESEIEKAVDEVLANSQGEIERFKAGDAKLMGFFVGQIMKITKGKANPKIVNELLKKKLS